MSLTGIARSAASTPLSSLAYFPSLQRVSFSVDVIRWDEKAGLRHWGTFSRLNLIMEPIAHLHVELPRIVPVEAAKSEAIVILDAAIGNV
jgi:hypothetical protein